ncbi:MAG: hypothetical protein LDLANPLL_02396 [Turneriella sp.]|nr:hypothetical protein [Turneriella sp.]
MHDLIRQFLFLGFGFAVLMALSQSVVRNPTVSNRVYAALYVSIAVIQFTGWNSDAHFHYVFPHFSMIEIPFIFLIGPLLYILYSEILPEPRRRRYWLHFVAPTIVLCSMLPYYLRSVDLKANRLEEIFIGGETNLEEVLFFLSMLVNTGYFVVLMRKMTFLWKEPLTRKESAARLLLFLISLAVIIGFISIACLWVRNILLLKSTALLMFFAICVNFLYQFRFPEVNQRISYLMREARYRHSQIKGINTDDLKMWLEAAMVAEKMFLNEELSLAKLAAHLKVSVHQLSEFLNTVLKTGFARYVNGYRVAEAKRLLNENHEMNILQIAYESGFNSISSFHRAFVGIERMSPKAFRQLKSPGHLHQA